MTVTKQREGLIDVEGGRVWHKIVGSGTGVPLLLLHGGPGAGHDYLEPLEALGDERPVVFYDQLGCGKSDIPDDTSLWTPERFAREVQAVRDALGFERVHLLGQSWGGWLLLEYMAGKPQGIVSLTLASTSASVQSFLDAIPALLAELPQDVQDTIARCEAEGNTDTPEYMAATFAFYQNFLCRMPVWPESMMRTGINIQKTPVYHHMWGPSEFTLTGTLEGWTREDLLETIDIPTLITVGRYDEIQASISESMHKRIKGSQLVIFEESAHSAHAEEAEKYAAVLRDFLPPRRGRRVTFSNERPLLRGYFHLGAAIAAVIGFLVLLLLADTASAYVGGAVFAVSLIGLYSVSATYHTINWGVRMSSVLKRVDHSMIFVMIAGSYTPICLLALDRAWGISLLAVVWTIAALGIALKVAWPNAPRWLSVGLYLATGWLGIVAVSQLFAWFTVPSAALLIGAGVVYSLGGLVYGFRRPNPFPRVFGYHEVFHVLVIVGSVLHYTLVAGYLM